MMNKSMKQRVCLVGILAVSMVLVVPFMSDAEDMPASLVVLDLQTALERAITASEDLQIQQNETVREQSKYRKEWAALEPIVSGEVLWTDSFKYPDLPENVYKKKYSFDAGITVSQTVFTFGRIFSSIAAAQRSLEASRFASEGKRQEILYITKVAYYTAALAQKTLAIAQRSLENAQQNKTIVEKRNEHGRISHYDTIKVSADISSRIPAVTSAQASVNSAMETFKRIVGIDRHAQVQLVEPPTREYPAFERAQLARALYEHQPMIRSLAAAVSAKDFEVRSKKAACLPIISAFGTWDHTGSSNNYYVGSEHLNGYGVAGLKMTIPLWAGGITREEIAQARLDKKNAELAYQKGKEEYLLEVDKVWGEYEGYRTTLAANEEAVKWAEESFRLSQDMLAAGQISLTDLNDAELRLTNQRLQRESTLFYLEEALARIERLTLIGAHDEH